MEFFCRNRNFEAILLNGRVDKSKLKFDAEVSLNNGPPKVDASFGQESLSVKLVKSKDNESTIVGVQLLVGMEVKLTQRLCNEIHVPIKPSPVQIQSPQLVPQAALRAWTNEAAGVEVVVQQIMGIPSNDGKQHNILGGLMGCGVKCAYPCCTNPREDFKKMGERLFELMEASGYDSQDFPHTLHELREDGNCTTECAKEYLNWMDNNRMAATE